MISKLSYDTNEVIRVETSRRFTDAQISGIFFVHLEEFGAEAVKLDHITISPSGGRRRK